MAKTISFTLDAASIGKAIKELNDYTKDFEQKCKELRKRVAEKIRWSAENGFSQAIVSDVILGDADLTNDVQVTVSHDESVSIVMASGTQAVFIEYGAGVYHNGGEGMIGLSTHPWVEDGTETRPFFIGMYGDGKGAHNAWGYYKNGVKSQDNVVVTRGTPAAMPMYRGYMEAINTIGELIQEVFG